MTVSRDGEVAAAVERPANAVPGKKGFQRLPDEDRFWSQIVVVDSCWWWTGTLVAGYGVFSVTGRKTLAHRWAYERFVGSIPAGLQLDHLCRNKGCVNPHHVEPVTNRENQMRYLLAEKPTCPNGHPYDVVQPIYKGTKAGGIKRYCRQCKNAARRAAYARSHP